MAKRLVVFCADGTQEGSTFFALVDAGMTAEAVQALAYAACSDANRAALKVTGSSHKDLNQMAKTIRYQLAGAGFEFLDAPVAIAWDNVVQDKSLVEVRLERDEVAFVRDADSGELSIPTKPGDISVNPGAGTWGGQGTTGTLKGWGYDQMLQLVELRGQPDKG
jgi:hypothetical protein